MPGVCLGANPHVHPCGGEGVAAGVGDEGHGGGMVEERRAAALQVCTVVPVRRGGAGHRQEQPLVAEVGGGAQASITNHTQ